MPNEPNKKLEELIHGELRKLPELPAPHNLVSRVMAVLAERERQPWWQRPWLVWPMAARSASLALLSVCIGVAGSGGYAAWQGLTPSRFGVQPLILLDWLRDLLATLGNAALVVLRAVNPVWMIAGLAFAAFVYLTCIGLGTVCYRVAFQPLLRR